MKLDPFPTFAQRSAPGVKRLLKTAAGLARISGGEDGLRPSPAKYAIRNTQYHEAIMHTQRELRMGLTLVALAALIWGTTGIAVSLLYGVSETNALAVGFWRLLLSAPALALLARVLVGPNFWRVQRKHLGPIGLIGVAFAGYQVAYFAAIPRLGVAAAVLINICSAPIFTALLARFFLGERLGPTTLAAMAGAIGGTALLVGGAPAAASTADLLIGAGLALSAGACYSLVVLGSRVVAPHYHPLQPITLAFSLGALLLLPVALGAGFGSDYGLAGWGLLLYLGLMPTALAYGLYLRGMRSVSATTAAILTLLEPLGSATLAVAFLGERLAPAGLIGAALLLGSMALLFVRPAERPQPTELSVPNER
jgi:drug/metabolite transporter, DME family